MVTFLVVWARGPLHYISSDILLHFFLTNKGHIWGTDNGEALRPYIFKSALKHLFFV